MARRRSNSCATRTRILIWSCQTSTCLVRSAFPPMVSLPGSRGLLAHEVVVDSNLLVDADMDGFRLLEQVGLEMDLPVISKTHRLLLCKY